MRRTASSLGILGLASIWLAGCPPTYPKCKSDDHCKEHNEICVQGQCQECATDANCKPGFTCQDNRCAPRPECRTKADCGDKKSCEAGKCVAKECEQDSDCPGGRCQANQCVKRSCAKNEDCPDGQGCQAGACQAKAEEARSCNFEPIRFGFNEHVLTPQAQRLLSSWVDCLKGTSSKITLEGHADERGTEEYNLQLSQRRAASVKKYLVDLGINPSMIQTVGYGENRPANPGHDEEAWAQNRRVEIRR